MVARTSPARASGALGVHPEAAADVPDGPVSWYGVARPRALSGLAGTMMPQLAGADETAPADACGWTETAGACDGLGEAPRDDWSILVPFPPERARTMPRVRPSAIGTPSGAAIRAARRSRGRRLAGRCPLSNSHPPPPTLFLPGHLP